LYIGGGDYSGIFDETAKTTLTLTPEASGDYSFESMGFGFAGFDASSSDPAYGYFSYLGYSHQPQAAVLASNFVGLGMPEYLWLQLTNLLYKVDSSFDSQLTCLQEQGGMCHLKNACSTYTGVWGKGWGFKVRFNSANDENYMIVPLGALAVDNDSTGECDIYIQYLDANKNPQSDQVIFGSLIMQQYKAWFDYDRVEATTMLKMQLSDTNTLTNSYIGNATITASGNPFVALADASAVMDIGTDTFHYKTTIRASLGFQGLTTFQVSMLGNYVYTYADSCMIATPGARQTSCEDEPVNAQTYFNSTIYYAKDTYSSSNYAGYNTSGEIYSAEVCLNTQDTPFFCTIYNQEFYVADMVYDDAWNYGSKANAGSVGFGAGSPVWAIVSNPDTKVFDINMNNFNDWTWADSSYVLNTTAKSVINFGAFDPDYTYGPKTTIAPISSGSYLFPLAVFGFGKTDLTANTEYYTDIMNFDTDITKYGFLANTTNLGLNFRGLGLPHTSFNRFSNLLSVATKGESTCLSRQSGYCLLAKSCDYYNKYNLWDYDFKIQFQTSSDTKYLRVPLATFAANY